MVSSEMDRITGHYEECWATNSERVTLDVGPRWQLPPGFRVLVFSPGERRRMWAYATCGMSQQYDAPGIEIHLFSPVKCATHIELLTAIAHYHVTGEYLGVGHTVNFGRPWLPDSNCDHGLISLPYLDGPKLEWLDLTSKRIQFLWLIPIEASEVEYKKSHGIEALESLFEKKKFDYLDPRRQSVV